MRTRTFLNGMQGLLTFLVFLFVCVEAWAQQPTVSWQTNVSGTAPVGAFDVVALDGAGNVIAIGNTTDTGLSFTVVKLDGASGAVVCNQVITLPDDFGGGGGFAVDGAGNVVVAGRGRSNPFPYPNFFFYYWLVIKFDGCSGAELWRRTDFGGDDTAEVHAVAVDGAGNVIVAGSSNRPSPLFSVRKYDGVSGATLWGTGVWGIGFANAVALDGAGNVVVAGETNFGGFTVAKLDRTSGAVLWDSRQGGLGSANVVAVDGTGSHVAAAGWTQTGTQNGTLVKFDGVSGTRLWERAVWAYHPVVDVAGNVVAALSPDNAIVKFDGISGAELWRYNFVGVIVTDRVGDVVVAGATQNVSGSSDFTVVKVDGASGTERWRQVIASASGTSGQALAVKVQGTGDVIAAGTVSNTATVVKLSEQLTVAIDIRPQGESRTITPQSHRHIRVAILSSADFDASARVDRASLTFGRTGDEQSLVSCQSNNPDVNGDGLPDVVCRFDAAATAFQAVDTQWVLKGRTVDSTRIIGRDAVPFVAR